jgi:uncharacterized protein DUF6089
MRHTWLLVQFFLLTIISSAQNFHLGLFGGTANYQGDLVDGPYKQTKGAFGLTLGYELTDHFMVRAGLTHGKVAGADKYSSKPDLRLRNLSFESKITELSLLLEYSAFNLYNRKYTPYFFGGLALYHFNPYATEANGLQVFLKPLSTEGQGLANYPDRKPYSLTQMSLPFGGGIRFALNDNVRLSLEIGLRKLFMDYLDDVSTTYVDPSDLLAEKGPKAVEISYRGDEVPGGSPFYPTKGDQRGGANIPDWYYFSGLHISFRLPGNNESDKKSSHRNGGSKGYGCPSSPL